MINLNTIYYYMIVLFFLMLGWLPPKLGLRLGALLGRLLFLLDTRHRKITLDNIRLALQLPEQEARQLGIRTFENLGRIIYEIGWIQRMKKAALYRKVRVEGHLNLKKAYAQDRGILVLTAHFGNWELLSILGGIVGLPVSLVYRPLAFVPLNRFFARLRGRFGAVMVTKAKSLNLLQQRLQDKHLVTLLMDQYRRRDRGVWVKFFNRPVSTSRGMALLAMKTGAPVVPIFLIRKPEGYTGLILPEVPLIQTGDMEKDLVANTAQYNRIIEDIIRQYPDQWFWIHRRWKHSA